MEVPEEYNFYKEHPECATDVFDQGQCSSSFVSSVTSVFSDRVCQRDTEDKFRAGVHYPLSCESRRVNGCDGGFLSNTLDFGMRYGFVSAQCMPYDPSDGQTCDRQKVKDCEVRKIKNYCMRDSKEEIKKEIILNGPVISIVLPNREYLSYKGGIFDLEGSEYPVTGATQMVKVVGWGQEDGVDYWVVEDSFGASWGEEGFARV